MVDNLVNCARGKRQIRNRIIRETSYREFTAAQRAGNIPEIQMAAGGLGANVTVDIRDRDVAATCLKIDVIFVRYLDQVVDAVETLFEKPL